MTACRVDELQTQLLSGESPWSGFFATGGQTSVFSRGGAPGEFAALGGFGRQR